MSSLVGSFSYHVYYFFLCIFVLFSVYFGSHYELDKVKDFLNKIENLWCIGRNGQHRYNNMDHSMMTAMVAVDHIATGNNDKSEVWSVNTEEEYHESK